MAAGIKLFSNGGSAASGYEYVVFPVLSDVGQPKKGLHAYQLTLVETESEMSRPFIGPLYLHCPAKKDPSIRCSYSEIVE